MADDIRDGIVSHKKLLAYLEDESIVPDVHLKLPVLKNKEDH